jgi:hypothetical protein
VQAAGGVALLVLDGWPGGGGGGGGGGNAAAAAASEVCSERFECGGWLGDRDYGDGDSDGASAAAAAAAKEAPRRAAAARQRHRLMAARDDPAAWQGVRIPVLLLTRAQGERLLRLLETELVVIDGKEQRYVL